MHVTEGSCPDDNEALGLRESGRRGSERKRAEGNRDHVPPGIAPGGRHGIASASPVVVSNMTIPSS